MGKAEIDDQELLLVAINKYYFKGCKMHIGSTNYVNTLCGQQNVSISILVLRHLYSIFLVNKTPCISK